MTTVEGTISRIQSFTFRNWDVRYKKISPNLCAQYGYKNSGENEIECEVCSQKIKFEDPYPEDVYDVNTVKTLVEDFRIKLANTHTDDCLFKNIIELPKIRRDFIYLNTRKYYQANLESYSANENIELPILDPKFKEYISQNDLIYLFGQLNLSEPLVAKPSEILSIFGWRYDNSLQQEEVLNEGQSSGPRLDCQFCGRKVLVNSFPTASGDLHQYGNEANQNLELFDVILEHKYFCKWGREAEQNQKQYGWQICLELLRFDKIRGNEQKKAMEPELVLQNESSQEKAHLDLVLEQTQFKEEVLKKIQELREFKERGLKRCNDVLNNLEKKKVKGKSSKDLEEKFDNYKKNLDDIIKELNLKVEPIKKVKFDDNEEFQPSGDL